MRFTQGYWVIRQDYVMSYATQTVRVITRPMSKIL